MEYVKSQIWTKIISASGRDAILKASQPLDKSLKSYLFFTRMSWGHAADPCRSHTQSRVEALGKDCNTCCAFLFPKLCYCYVRRFCSPSHLSSIFGLTGFAWLMGLIHTSASAQGTSRNMFPQHHKASSAGVTTALFPSGRIEYSHYASMYFSKSSTNFPVTF